MPTSDSRPGRFPLNRSGWDVFGWVTVALVCIPIGVAAGRAALGRWVPSGDDAYFTVRSRDVLTEHHPLLGAWSSGSVDLTHPINNLGPLQHDLLAPFTRWTPMGGTAVAVALINVACIVTIAWLIKRSLGNGSMVAAMLVVSLLTWTMGSEMLITPRQHQFLVVPYLCLLVATWMAARGDRTAIVVAVVTASLVAQTHLSYPVLVAALALVVLTGQLLTTRGGTATGGRTPLIVAVVVGCVLWLQTAIDQFAGFGNFTAVLTGSGEGERAGWATGGRIVAAVLVSADTLVRPGYAKNTGGEVSLAATRQVVLLWVLIVAALAWVVSTWRRRGWVQVAGPVVALVAVTAAVINAALLPRTRFGLRMFNYRWLWSTGAFVAIVVAIGIWQWWRDTRGVSERWQRPLAAVVLAACALPAVLNLPRSVQDHDSERYLSDQRNVAALLDQLDLALDSADINGPVVVDESQMYFGHPFNYPLLLELQQHGIEFRFESQIQERRFGTKRVADGTERQVLRLVAFDQALEAQSNPATLAFIDGERPVAILLEPLG